MSNEVLDISTSGMKGTRDTGEPAEESNLEYELEYTHTILLYSKAKILSTNL